MSAVTFGSVGDIIAVCLLAKQIVDSLDSARGSAAEYRSLATEIRSLEKTLLEVELLVRKYKDHNAAISVLDEVPDLIRDCRNVLYSLDQDLKKYHKHLKESPCSNLAGRVGMKVRWEVSIKDKVIKYRVQIAAHCNALNMAMITATVTMALLNFDSVEKSNEAVVTAHQEQVTLLSKIRESIQNNHGLSTSMTDMIRALMRRFDAFSCLITGVKALIHRGFMINLATYKCVLSIQELINHRVDNSMSQAPFLLEDAIGRVAPVHMQFITSWNALDAVLIARFEGLPGLEKVQRGEFTLQERATHREITRKRPWESAFRPGQKIDMSLTFEQIAKAKVKRNQCPNCSTESKSICNGEVTCSNCGMIYTIVTNIVDVEASMTHKMSNPRQAVFDQRDSKTTPLTFGPERNTRPDSGDWQDLVDQITPFKRVRILTITERSGDRALNWEAAGLSQRTKIDGSEDQKRWLSWLQGYFMNSLTTDPLPIVNSTGH